MSVSRDTRGADETPVSAPSPDPPPQDTESESSSSHPVARERPSLRSANSQVTSEGSSSDSESERVELTTPSNGNASGRKIRIASDTARDSLILAEQHAHRQRLQSLENPGYRLPDNLSFSNWEIFLLLFSMTLYIVDVGLDITLAVHYVKYRKPKYFFATLAFIIFPAVVQTAISLRWYLHDADRRDSKDREKVDRKLWLLRLICLSLQLGLVLRYLETLCYGLRFRWRRKSLFNCCRKSETLNAEDTAEMYRQMVYEGSETLLLRVVACFLQGIPQLFLQFYVLSHDAIEGSENFVGILASLQAASIIVKLIAIAWNLAFYNRHMRFCQEDHKYLSWRGTCLQTGALLSLLVARTLAIGLFGAVFHAWTFLFIAFHWVLMTTLLIKSDTQFCQSRFREWGFDMLLGFIYIFIFYNVSSDQTRYKYIFYYAVTCLSNTLMITLFFVYVEPQDIWFRIPAFTGHYFAFVFGIFILFIYYMYYHPRGSLEPFDVDTVTFLRRVSKPFKSYYSNLELDQGNIRHRNRTPSSESGSSVASSARQL